MSFTSVTRYWLAAMVVVVASSVGGGVSWSQAMTTPCTVTTSAPAAPANFTGTVNEEGILLRWDAPLESDKVIRYEILRGVGSGATPTRYGSIDVQNGWDDNSGTYGPIGSPVTSEVDYKHMLKVGETYVYAVAFERYDNCGGHQEGVQSDSVTVTYQPDE